MSQKTNLVFVTLLSLFLPLSVANAFEFRTPTDQAIYEQFGSEITEEQYGAVTHAMEQTGLEDPNDALDSAMHDEDLDSLTAACGESGECEDGEDYSSYANEADQADQEDGDSESSEEEDGDDAESSAEEGEAPVTQEKKNIPPAIGIDIERLPGSTTIDNTDPAGGIAYIYEVMLGNATRGISMGIAAFAVLSIVIGGFMYITAMGNSAQTDKAKNTIIYAVAALLIMLFAYTIVSIINNLLTLL